MLKKTVRYAATFLMVISIAFQAQATETSKVRDAISNLKTIAGWPVEESVTPLLDQFDAANFDDHSGPQLAHYVFNDLNMHKWGNNIVEFTDLISLIFSFQEPDTQSQYQAEFDAHLETVHAFRAEMNQIVSDNHPGLNLGHKRLMKRFTGKSIKIAVFDVFDSNLYEKQRSHYSQATFEPIHNIGNPVELNHGNSVIDVLLQIAPEITIVPVSAESSTYNEAMKYILSRDDIQIVNMSRAFAEKDGELDSEFSVLLQRVLSSKIVTKSLGNTGTDLNGNLSPIRINQNLPPIGNLFAYDLPLIRSFIDVLEMQPKIDHLLFAINMETFAENVSLTATIPGNDYAAISRSVAIPADAVYSWSTGNFEAGSSFAAPQLAAISALLWEACLKKDCAEAEGIPAKVSHALKQTTRPGCQNEEETGLGMINAGRALRKLSRWAY